MCRAGLALGVTGALAAAGGTPWAPALVALGVALLGAGGWMISHNSRRR